VTASVPATPTEAERKTAKALCADLLWPHDMQLHVRVIAQTLANQRVRYEDELDRRDALLARIRELAPSAVKAAECEAAAYSEQVGE